MAATIIRTDSAYGWQVVEYREVSPTAALTRLASTRWNLLITLLTYTQPYCTNWDCIPTDSTPPDTNALNRTLGTLFTKS